MGLDEASWRRPRCLQCRISVRDFRARPVLAVAYACTHHHQIVRIARQSRSATGATWRDDLSIRSTVFMGPSRHGELRPTVSPRQHRAPRRSEGHDDRGHDGPTYSKRGVGGARAPTHRPVRLAAHRSPTRRKGVRGWGSRRACQSVHLPWRLDDAALDVVGYKYEVPPINDR